MENCITLLKAAGFVGFFDPSGTFIKLDEVNADTFDTMLEAGYSRWVYETTPFEYGMYKLDKHPTITKEMLREAGSKLDSPVKELDGKYSYKKTTPWEYFAVNAVNPVFEADAHYRR